MLYFCTSWHPAALPNAIKLWKEDAISHLLWLWAHCDVSSYLVGLVRVFSLVDKGTFFVYVAGMGSNDCGL